jgi:hypothetical protein
VADSIREKNGVMECWSDGVLECWSDGVLECWSVGVLECWSVGSDRTETRVASIQYTFIDCDNPGADCRLDFLAVWDLKCIGYLPIVSRLIPAVSIWKARVTAAPNKDVPTRI